MTRIKGPSTPQTEPVRSVAKQLPVPWVIDTTEKLIRKGQLVPEEEFQTMMGWRTPQAVWRALAAHRIFAMYLGASRYFPAFFADPAYKRTHLAAVTKQLGDLPGGAKLQFFVSKKGSLNGKTTLEALAEGQVEKVLLSAAAYSES